MKIQGATYFNFIPYKAIIPNERTEPGLESDRCRGSRVDFSSDSSSSDSSNSSSFGVISKVGLLSLSVSCSGQQEETLIDIIEPGRDNDRCLGSPPTVSSVSSGTAMRFGLSSVISSNCLDSRRGGGESDVIPVFSSANGGNRLGFSV